MNKLLIVLLAVCLFSVVSAHTFMKRDAPTPATDVTAQINAVRDKVTEITNDITKKISEAINPDVIKKNTNDLIDSLTQTFEKLKPAAGDATTPSAGDAKPAAQ